jgi:hypothetical protein
VAAGWHRAGDRRANATGSAAIPPGDRCRSRLST